MGIGSIPDGELERLYQFVRLALSQKSMIDGLTEHYRQINHDEILGDETASGFSDILRELSSDSLVDLFYETAISNACYEEQTRQFYIDPKCTRGYSIDGLYAHLYRDALENCLSTIVSNAYGAAIQIHLADVLAVIDSGRSKADLRLGNLHVDISPARGQIRLTLNNTELLFPVKEKEAVEFSLRQWNRCVKGIELDTKKQEGYAP
jgi:hypothetical protein